MQEIQDSHYRGRSGPVLKILRLASLSGLRHSLYRRVTTCSPGAPVDCMKEGVSYSVGGSTPSLRISARAA